MKTNSADNNLNGVSEEENPFGPVNSLDDVWEQAVRNIIGEEFSKDIEGEIRQDADNRVVNKEEV